MLIVFDLHYCIDQSGLMSQILCYLLLHFMLVEVQFSGENTLNYELVIFKFNKLWIKLPFA